MHTPEGSLWSVGSSCSTSKSRPPLRNMLILLAFFSPLYHHYLSSLSIIRVWKKSLQSDKSGSFSRDTSRRRIWSSAELTGDVIISRLQIVNIKRPCTRSNTTIASSTNKIALISQSNGPLLSSIAPVFVQCNHWIIGIIESLVQSLDLSLDAPSRYFLVMLELLRLKSSIRSPW